MKKISWRKNELFRRLAAASIIWFVVTLIFENDLGTQNLTRHAEIKIRNYLDKDPKFDPSLKMIFFDDRFAASYKKPDFSFEEWKTLIKEISKYKPKVIIIDKAFSFSFDQQNFDKLGSFLRQNTIPVNAGVLMTPKGLTGRDDASDIVEAKTLKDSPYVNKIPFNEAQAIGPIKGLASSFASLGHFVYHGDGNGRASLLWRYEQDKIAPHLTLTDSQVELKANGVYINGHKASELSAETTPIDLILADKYYTYYNSKENLQILGLTGIIKAIEGKKNLAKYLKEGDTILISKTFSGSTDFIKTPAGRMSGALFMASIINSTLTGKWLYEVSMLKRFHGIPILILIFIFVFVVKRFSINQNLLIVTLVTLGIVALSIYLFIYKGWVIEWLYCSICFLFASMTVVADRALSLDIQSNMYQVALRRTLPKDRLKDILIDPTSVSFKSCYKNVTIMFVDIIKFSSIAEKMPSEEVFTDLKKVLNRTIEVIHKHGGVVDKTLGDGILAYFGYRFDNSAESTSHPCEAVRCAIEIQQQNLIENLKDIEGDSFPYVVRIGLNSSSVFIGNIGDQKIPDITLIGQGVNFAQRLEAACDPFKILISDATKSEMKQSFQDGVDQKMTQKEIIIKHHKDPKPAWQIDPVKGSEDKCQQILDKLNKLLN